MPARSLRRRRGDARPAAPRTAAARFRPGGPRAPPVPAPAESRRRRRRPLRVRTRPAVCRALIGPLPPAGSRGLGSRGAFFASSVIRTATAVGQRSWQCEPRCGDAVDNRPSSPAIRLLSQSSLSDSKQSIQASPIQHLAPELARLPPQRPSVRASARLWAGRQGVLRYQCQSQIGADREARSVRTVGARARRRRRSWRWPGSRSGRACWRGCPCPAVTA